MRVRVTVPMAVKAAEAAAVRHAAVQAAIIDQARELAARPAQIDAAHPQTGEVIGHGEADAGR